MHLLSTGGNGRTISFCITPSEGAVGFAVTAGALAARRSASPARHCMVQRAETYNEAAGRRPGSRLGEQLPLPQGAPGLLVSGSWFPDRGARRRKKKKKKKKLRPTTHSGSISSHPGNIAQEDITYAAALTHGGIAMTTPIVHSGMTPRNTSSRTDGIALIYAGLTESGKRRGRKLNPTRGGYHLGQGVEPLVAAALGVVDPPGSSGCL